jgi:hypothetical protein
MGYDPYDILNCPIDLRIFGKWLPIVAIQLQKRSPLNFRPLLKIKKEHNPKALGLFLTAYSNLAKLNGNANFEDTFSFLLNRLSATTAKRFSGTCWGYNFDWASPKKFLPRYAPSVVVTGFVCKGLFDYYRLTGNDRVIELLEQACQFILRDLPRTRIRDGIVFSYTPFARDACLNASLLGAEILAKVYSINGKEKLKELAKAALDFVIAHQKEDGRWNYSIDLKTGNERSQIDFHQGYVLESIYEIVRYLGLNPLQYTKSLRRGAEFYRQHQFFTSGQSKWRLPRVWPVDIHNQAQGIITFSRLAELDSRYLAFAKTIALWTIEHMQDSAGYFYYRKYRIGMNKISYMRWAQAWMMVALPSLLIENQKRS